MKNRVFSLEGLNFAELAVNQVYRFVFPPLRIKGATGSPGRPLVIR